MGGILIDERRRDFQGDKGVLAFKVTKGYWLSR